MVIINSYSNKRFTLNGIQYLKNYVSRVSGNRVQIYNCYDNADVLADYDIYGNYIVNGETFSNAALLQEALLEVIFSRGTLGNDVQALVQDNQREVFDIEIDTQDTEAQILDKINSLPLYLIDEHSLVSYKCYDGNERVLVYNTVGIGKGSYGVGGTQLTSANLLKVYEYVPYVNQNNVHSVRTYTTQDTSNTPTTSQVAMLINSSLPISFSETDIPWIAVNVLGTSPLKKHIYWFNGGKGLWGGPVGAGGSTVNRGMLQYLLTQNATPQDVQDGGNTSVIPLGVLPDGNYITAANAVERDLSNPDLYYFLKFTVEGIEYLLQFIGSDYGMYGGGNTLQFTDSDFEEMPVAETSEPYIPSLQEVTQTGAISTEPITVQHINPSSGAPIGKTVYSGNSISYQPEGGNSTALVIEEGTEETLTRSLPASDQDEEVAYRSYVKGEVVNGRRALPDGFYVANTYTTTNQGKYISYLTDSLKTLDIGSVATPIILTLYSESRDIYATGATCIIKNDIYIEIWETDPVANENGQKGILRLKGCYIDSNNILKYSGYDYRRIPVAVDANGARYQLHGVDHDDKFIYLASRQVLDTTNTFDNTDTVLYKINRFDLTDIRTASIPAANPNGYVSEILVHDEYVYLAKGIGTSTNGFAFMRIDKNDFTTVENLFTLNGDSSQARLPSGTPFTIYDDFVYVPTVNNNAGDTTLRYNSIGIMKYSISKKVKVSQNIGVYISTGQTVRPVPHWMKYYNGSIILHTGSGPATPANSVLVRFKADDLSFQESLQLPTPSKYANDNTITHDGWIYLNPESNYQPSLVRYRWNNFTEQENISLPAELPGGFYAIGSTLYNYGNKTRAKYNLSDFNNDISTGIGTVTNVTGTSGEITVTTGTTTPVVGINTAYTSARNSYADAKVADNLTASTTVAPSKTAVNTALALKENTANKQNSLTADGTGIKFPTVDAVNAGLADKITIDDVYPLLGESERVESVATGLTSILDYLDVAVKGTGTAYYNGKNFYNTVWANTSGGTSLISQGLDKFDVNVTAGTFRASNAVAKVFPAGTFTASVEVTILTGNSNNSSTGSALAPYLYVYRTGQTPSSTAVVLMLSEGKYIGNITFTNTAETTLTLSLQHSTGTSVTAHTASIAMQVEYGSTNTYITPFNGGSVALSNSEYPLPSSAIYVYPAASSSLTIVRTRFLLGSALNKIVDCWGDSLTEGTGSTTGKPASDTNSDVSYPAQLGRMLVAIDDDFTVRNLGVGGETSWMIAARQGGMSVKAEPFVMPADLTAKRIYISGIEQDYYYTAGAWTYLNDNLSYNFAIGAGKGVNPVRINGVEGNLTRTLLTPGTPDPTTGETVSSATYAYYFTRTAAGTGGAILSPKEIVTLAKSDYSNDIMVIWMGQNDAPEHSGSYPLQKGSYTRARRMVEVCKQANRRYIIINAPAGSNTGNAAIDQDYALEFGSNFLNIRDFICRYGVDIAAAAGYDVEGGYDNTYIGSSTIDGTYPTVETSHAAGVIARNFRIDGVHGNYWYYYIVATAIKEKGKDLGYW